jgi:hypothetical protein
MDLLLAVRFLIIVFIFSTPAAGPESPSAGRLSRVWSRLVEIWFLEVYPEDFI